MKHFRIVHCANFQLLRDGEIFYTMDSKISNGLIRNGHYVYDFSYRDIAKESNVFKSKKFGIKKMNERFFDTVKNIKPDILFLGHTELIKLETLEKIKEMLPDIKIVMWWIDWFEPEDKIEHIKNRKHLIDVFFTSVDPSLGEKKLTDVQFPIYFMPNMCDEGIETFKGFEKENYLYDLIYVGRLYNNEKKGFFENVKQLKKIKFKHYGKENPVFGIKYFEELVNAKIGINFSMYNNVAFTTSDRLVHMSGNGLCVMSPRVPKLDILFNEKEIVYFDDFEDFEKKLYYYLKNEDKRKEIAYNGWKKAHEKYNSTRITKYMIECVNGKFSENYEWLEGKK